MSLRFILGRAGVGKTYRCFTEIKDILDEEDYSRNLILLVPEQFTLQTERDLIEKMELDGILNVEVISFRRLASKVFSEVGGITRVPLNDLGRKMVLRKVINEVRTNLSIYRKVSKQIGFVNKVGEIISDLKKHSISTVKLEEISKNTSDNVLLNEKLSDISLIYSRFQNYFKDKYINPDDILTIAANKVSSSAFFSGSEIWIDGFDNFNAQEYEVIKELLKTAYRVNITLTLEPYDLNNAENNDLFYTNKQTMNNIIKIAKEVGVEIEQEFDLFYENTRVVNRYRQSKALQHLEQNIFSYPYNAYKEKQQDITIFYSNSRYSEIKKIAQEIIRLSSEKHYSWNDMAVISGNEQDYNNIVKAIFSDYDIPYFIDEKEELKHHPLVKFIFGALEIITSNWKYEAVFGYLKTYMLEYDKNDIDILENYVIAYGIKGAKWTEDSAWDYNEAYIELINKLKDSIREPIIELSKKLKQYVTIREKCRYLIEFLIDMHVYSKLEDEAVQIWDLTIEVFDEMVEILGDEEASVSEFYELVQAGFEGCEFGNIPPSLDQVLVGNLERSRSHDIKALFLIGANDGCIPPINEDSGFITDSERDLIKSMGYEFIEDTDFSALQSQFLVYSALTRPSNLLHISYALADDEGRALRPSIIINKLKKIYPETKEYNDVIHKVGVGEENDDMPLVSLKRPTFTYLVEALRNYYDKGKINELWKDVYSFYKSDDVYSNVLANINEALFYSNIEQNIEKTVVKKLYGDNIRTSVSRIEDFNSCPYSYFVKYGLKAAERKEFKLRVPDIGQIFHLIIECFSFYVRDNNIDWNDLEAKQCEKIVDEISENIIDKLGNGILMSSNKYKYLVKRIKRVSTRTIITLVEHIKKGSFTPFDFEMKFGEGSKFKPIKIELNENENMYLSGRIDRIDTLDIDDKKYIKIIDYKSGNIQFNLTDVYYGINLQLVVYMDDIISDWESKYTKEIIPAGIFYFKVDDPIVEANPEEDIRSKILKELRMEGLVLSDLNVVKNIDDEIEEKHESDVIPVKLTKENEFYKTSSVASIENFNLLRKYVKDTIIQVGNKILNGNVDINPIRKDKYTVCQYCGYDGICQFDKLFKDNKYKSIRKLTNEQFWTEIKTPKE